MKTFVMYGAGNIGRGFIGATFAKAGYAVKFIDVNMVVIDALNAEKKYPVEIVSNEGSVDEWIENVSGIDGRDGELVAETIANADAMATAVGVNIMPRIVPLIVAGIVKRFERGEKNPFNIIICENLLDADKLMRSLILERLNDEQKAYFEEYIGLVETSIGRMVPVMTEEMRKGQTLRSCVEKYCQLPIDKAAWKGEIPAIENLYPYEPFSFFIRRKLFIHNMGHASSAYMGKLLGCEYIWQSVKNPVVELIVERAMRESARALTAEFDYPLTSLVEHIDDLVLRFGNKALGDTVARVGKDTKRKLSPSDRFAGALKLCEEKGVPTMYISVGAACALFFKEEGDEGSDYIQTLLHVEGIDAVISKHMEICLCSDTAKYIKAYYALLCDGKGVDALLDAAKAFEAAKLSEKKIV